MKQTNVEQFELPAIASRRGAWGRACHVDERPKLEAWLELRRERWSETPLERLLGEFWGGWMLAHRVRRVRLPKAAVPPKAKREKREKREKKPKLTDAEKAAKRAEKKAAKVEEKRAAVLASVLDERWAAWGKSLQAA